MSFFPAYDFLASVSTHFLGMDQDDRGWRGHTKDYTLEYMVLYKRNIRQKCIAKLYN